MRPYLAIIKDSFRAALSSRVLYVLLGLILLFLLVIAPLHVRESLDTTIILDRDVRPAQQALLVGHLKQELDSGNKGVQRIWDSLSQDVRDKVDRAAESESESDSDSDSESNKDDDDQPRRGRRRRGGSNVNQIFAAQAVATELNEMIEDPEFFRAEDWKGGSYGSETTGYLEKGASSLTSKQKKRLNRLLITESFGGRIDKGAPTSLDFYYGPFDWSQYLAGLFVTNNSQDQFALQVSSRISWILDKIVLSIGLLIAILVTANIVPQTFEPGTLNLLLSKPMSRTGLFLAKFVGGCMFIALCAFVLFVGLWMWMGFGLGVWDRAVLISIPLYVVVFAIYYSVSSLTGLVTRSTILAIVATGMFWALCWSVGTLYNFFNAQMESSEITQIVSAGGKLYSTDPGLEPRAWDSGASEWADVNAPELDEEEKIQRAMIGMMGVDIPFPDPMGVVHVENKELTAFSRVLFADATTHRKQQFFVNQGTGKFERQGVLPSGTVAMFATSENIICANRRGRIYRYDAERTFEKENTDRETWFVSAGPDDRIGINGQQLIAVNRDSEKVAIYNSGTITILAVDPSDEDRKYTQLKSEKIDTGTRENMTCQIAWQGSTIMLAFGNGKIILVDADSLEKKDEFIPDTRVAIDSIEASPDGRWFSLLYKNETLRLVDAENSAVKKPGVRGQGSISSVYFDESKMYVADRTDRITDYDLASLSAGETYSPAGTMMQNAWRYGIKPLYFAFPKPGEFYKVVTHLSSSSDAADNTDVDLTQQRVRPNPWSPLISGLAFMAVMLGLSCLVFARTDY